MLALAVRPLRIFLLQRGDCCHAAMVPLATQPANEGTLQEFGIKPVGFGSSMLTRYRDTRRVDHISFNAAHAQPARQPEAVTASLERDHGSLDRMAGLDCLVPPALQQTQ